MTRSNRAQLTLGLLLGAALVPAAGLAYLQYRSLSEMREQARQALLENLKQRLVGARLEVETDFLTWPRRTMLGDEQHDWLRRGDLEKIHHVSEIVRRICPYVSLFFAYQFSPGEDKVWIFRPTREPWNTRLSENDSAEAGIRNLVPQIVLTKHHFYNFYTDLDGERQQVFFHLCDEDLDPAHPRAAGYIGFAAPTRVLADRYLPAVLKKHLARLSVFNTPIPENQLWVAAMDETGRAVGPSHPGAAGAFTVQERFPHENAILPGWVFEAGLAHDQAAKIYGGQAIKGIGFILGTTALLLSAIVAIGISAIRLIHSSRHKSEFVASVSHELKTPLSLIRGYVETLRLNRLRREEDRREYFRVIEAEIQRLSGMIDRILESSKIEAEIKSYRPELIDVQAVIEEAVDRFSYELEKEQVTLDCRIDRIPLTSMVDPQGLSDAVRNLLSNAVKYSGEVRRVRLEVCRSEGRIAISITDHGIGIAKHEQRRIFKKFYRVDSGPGKHVQGAGLGLALVKHFAEAHGGSVSVQSEPGKGSTFTILLPAAVDEPVRS
jgi:two-component system phosphate regulon sensor histidine kinase PhoR